MARVLQRALLVAGAGALVFVLAAIGLSIGATRHGDRPDRVTEVAAGPYPLTVALYRVPVSAGFALPFAIAPRRPVAGPLRITVTSVPQAGVAAWPIRASVRADSATANAVLGEAEIPVQGEWQLLISVDGPLGSGEAAVPITATAPPPMPEWLAWSIGYLPLLGLLVFASAQRPPRAERP